MSHIVGFISSYPLLVGIVLLLIIYALQTPILTFPIYFLSFYAGLIYGMWFGSLINYGGILLTTVVGYYGGVIGKGERLMQRPQMEKFRDWVDRNGMKSIAFLRVIPVIPYNIVSIGSGLMKLDRRRYVVTNAISIIPYAVTWAVLGDVLGVVLDERLHFEWDYRLLIPTVIILLVIALILIVTRRSHQSKSQVKEISSQL